MVIKKLWQVGLLSMGLISAMCLSAPENNPFGQTIRITTRLQSFVGHPSWLLIMRNMETGQVFPYLFDFKHGNNFWLALSFSRAYRITVSTLDLGPWGVIHNFCHLQSGVIAGDSLSVRLTGRLRMDPTSYQCQVSRYKEFIFPVVEGGKTDEAQ